MATSSGSSTVMQSTVNTSMSSSRTLLRSTSSLSPKRSSSEISKTYKQASQLFLTRRLVECLEVIEPITTPPMIERHTNGHATDIEEEEKPIAKICMGSASQRIKLWSLYITLLNAIVDLGDDEGKREFGVKRYRTIVAKVRDGSIWEQVVRDGYKGREGSVDAEVVYNLYAMCSGRFCTCELIIFSATLLLGQAPSQQLTQARLETYLSASSHPELDISAHLSRSTSSRNSYMNGTSTPRELTSRLKILELFTLHVLPRNEEWDFAQSFIKNSDILDEERKEEFLIMLQELQGQAEADEDYEEAQELQREKDEELIEEQHEQVLQQAEAAIERSRSQENGKPTLPSHRRTSSEVDYGIEKSNPTSQSQSQPQANGLTNPTQHVSSSSLQSLPPPPSRPMPSRPLSSTDINSQAHPPSSSRKSALSPISTTPRPLSRPFSSQSKRTPAKSQKSLSQARLILRSLQNLFLNTSKSLSSIRLNSQGMFQTFLFIAALLMALSSRVVREKVKAMIKMAWEKVRATAGMGVKVSYI